MGKKFTTMVVAVLGLALLPATPAVAVQPEALWQKASPAQARTSARADIDPKRFAAYTLNHDGMGALLAATGSAAGPAVVSLPVPDGGFERFTLTGSPVMEPALAAAHPEIKTFSGKGIDDPTATVRADLTPLGFHASVRSSRGSWYVDPYFNQSRSLYASYFGRDLNDTHGEFAEREDVEEAAHEIATEIGASVAAGQQVTRRTYRLAMVTDPSYASYFGAANVTAAKVTLVNRVTQIYEDETAIRLILVGATDATNLNTAALATEPNGPCGSAPCFTPAQLSACSSAALNRNRIVLGQIVGASNYDVGHLALGVNGGGVAGLGVVGGDGKARGCTGLPTPVGDFFAVDYVAHEIGHQFAGNHTFNGTQVNCSGGNRNAPNSVEPGSGSSIMAYAGICRQDNLQPHSDPYWSQRSYTEITTFVNSNRPAINEVQTVSLRDFDTDGDRFTISFNGAASAPITRGVNYTVADIKAVIEAIPGWPAGASVTVAAFGGTGTLNDTGFQVTFNGGPLAAVNVPSLEINGVSGFTGETAKGGAVDNGGNLVELTGNHAPVVTVPSNVTIPVRTPFALTGSATDADGHTVTYMWEQNDRGGATGTTLVSNLKVNGPLFRQFGEAAIVSPEDTLKYYSPGENAVSTDPTRVFPDLSQIAAGNTNAKTGQCATAPPSPAPVPAEVLDCYSEFLPTADWVGLNGDRVMHFRLTARDGNPGAGGIGNADVALTLAPEAGPFLVTSQPGTLDGGTTQTIAWDVAGTDAAPVNAATVRITLSADGGKTFPHVLASGTANDGSEAVTVPNIATTKARIRIEAVGNVFFALNDADFTVRAAPVVANDAPGGVAEVQYSDALAVTVTATDADSAGATLSATATGLPAGLSLTPGPVSEGAATWTVTGTTTAAPGDHPVTVAVSDDAGLIGTTAFTIRVSKEDATVTYTGDTLAGANGATTVHLRATVQDRADGSPGDVTNATVTFKEGGTTLCTAPVGLIGTAVTTGSAHCSATLSTGAHTVTAEVGGYYTASVSVAVNVGRPDGTFITSGGFLPAARSAGAYPADPGSRTGFAVVGFSGKNSTGHAFIEFTSGGRDYLIHSGSLQSLGFQGDSSANLRATAGLIDVTDPLRPIRVADGLTLQLAATDAGRDSLAITLWDGNTLLFSSDWTGAATQQVTLGGGAIVIH